MSLIFVAYWRKSHGCLDFSTLQSRGPKIIKLEAQVWIYLCLFKLVNNSLLPQWCSWDSLLEILVLFSLCRNLRWVWQALWVSWFKENLMGPVTINEGSDDRYNASSGLFVGLRVRGLLICSMHGSSHNRNFALFSPKALTLFALTKPRFLFCFFLFFPKNSPLIWVPNYRWAIY